MCCEFFFFYNFNFQIDCDHLKIIYFLCSSQTLKWEKDLKKTKSDGFTTSLLKTIQCNTMDQTEEEQVEDNDNYKNVIKKEVNIIKADNPDAIYIQFKDESIRNKYVEMDRNLQQFYSKNKIRLKAFDKGVKCIIYRKNVNHYDRATILDVTNQTVELCETAEIIQVARNDFYVLDDQFRIYPNFTFKCHLDGILPAGDSKNWSYLAVEYLQEIFKNQSNILMTKSGVTDQEKNSWPVIMWYVELVNNGPLEPTQRKLHCINKELTTNGLALKKRSTYKKPTVTEEATSNEVVLNSTTTDLVEVAQSLMDSITVTPITSHEIVVNISTPAPMEVEDCFIDYPPAPPITKQRMSGIVTYIDDCGVIHLQDYDKQKPFSEMVMRMNAYFSNTEPEVEKLQAGDLCTIRYSDNQYWYRGKVIKREKNDTYKVLVTDYGNIESCKHEDLRKTVTYLDLPSFSHKVKLHKVFAKEKKWLTSDIDVLQELLAEKKIILVLKEKATDRHPAFVDMYLEDGLFVNEYILKHSSNLSRELFKKRATHTCIDNGDDVIIDDIIEEIVYPHQQLEQQKMYQFTELPAIDTKLEVGIVSVLDYNSLIFEINNNLENENFITMSEDMQRNSDKQPNLNVIEVGQPCIARYSEDQQWYRAQIMEILTSDVVKVWFVDFGNFEDVRKKELKEIKQDWLKYPLQQFRAKLYAVKLRDESKLEEILTFFADLCGTVQTVKIIEHNPLKIEILKPNSENDELLYWDLIEQGILAL